MYFGKISLRRERVSKFANSSWQIAIAALT